MEPPNGIDKSRVLDVKPLRTLTPVFPAGGQAPNFGCMPPFGHTPNGFSPFYPFNAPPQATQQAPDLNNHVNHTGMQTPVGHMPAPLRSYRAPNPSAGLPHDFPEESNGDRESSMGGTGDEDGYFDGHKDVSAHRGSSSARKTNRASSSRKKVRKRGDADALFFPGNKGSGVNFVSVISPTQLEDGNIELVNYVLMNFDAVRRRICQIEDTKEKNTDSIKRADLKAGNIAMTKKVRTNMRRRIGAVPGVGIGDIFFFRMEMCVVGLHAPSMAGIDYMTLKGDLEKDPIALSIVSSGGYEDDTDSSDVLIYSGQGGNTNNKDKLMAVTDQKLERGNLALERSLHRGNEVRVIRGLKDDTTPNSKVYIYDGLYKIQESWMERGKSGGNMFKYKIVRVPGQPDAFSVLQTIRKWKDGTSSRPGLVLPDLTSAAERIPVSLVNEVDNEKGPAYFTYFPSLKYSKSFTLMQPSLGCNCRSACLPGDMNCSCIQNNEGEFPYTGNGILVSRKQLVYECGSSCPCAPNCKNRVSQGGLKVRLEVFRTKDRGWGLWSWDPIRAGTFICEYAGEVIDELKFKNKGYEGETDEFIFDTRRDYNPFKWNYEPGLLDEESPNESVEDYSIPYPLIISAKNAGNVSRFINHSCSPNVFWQPVLYEQNNQSFLHIGFFAIRHIPPLTELTYDYGISMSVEVDNNNGPHRRKKCLCGSSKCRGYFG
ncbi:histone-lysine N-methyltransferase, H3 lysine-9 specific SUVH1 [Argentina anserina]|uniref:histone-lysine N-methyltransferase, H3 lysine-9 specific SUVH1 n=1 Tax=Argentina anserina TaxID=57926 RepID=UPI002176710F|nr:histone-lysine N-methyltransferase, H3 lysine-9 specific SUVH1 [Potentilla anserina]